MLRVAAGTATGSSRALGGAWFVLHWLEFWFSENPWIEMVYPVHYTGKYWKHLSTFWSWMRMETCPPTASCRRAPQGAERSPSSWRNEGYRTTIRLGCLINSTSREKFCENQWKSAFHKLDICQFSGGSAYQPIIYVEVVARLVRFAHLGFVVPPDATSLFFWGTANLCSPPSRTLRPSRHAMWSASRCSRSLDWSDLVHHGASPCCSRLQTNISTASADL